MLTVQASGEVNEERQTPTVLDTWLWRGGILQRCQKRRCLIACPGRLDGSQPFIWLKLGEGSVPLRTEQHGLHQWWKKWPCKFWEGAETNLTDFLHACIGGSSSHTIPLNCKWYGAQIFCFMNQFYILKLRQWKYKSSEQFKYLRWLTIICIDMYNVYVWYAYKM